MSKIEVYPDRTEYQTPFEKVQQMVRNGNAAAGVEGGHKNYRSYSDRIRNLGFQEKL